jgi:hypothetical protein
MDDFFKFLIWAIIIISFFSSFFKKYKGKKTPSPPQRRQNDPYRQNEDNYSQSTSTPSTNEDQRDVFKEIEKLFKGEVPPQVQKAPPVERTTLKSKTAIEKSEYESILKKQYIPEKLDNEWHEETASEHVMETDWDKEKKKLVDARKKVSSKIEEEAQKFEMFLNKEEKFDRLAYITIRERLKHPQSLKEFMVISEILGKPKALRK